LRSTQEIGEFKTLKKRILAGEEQRKNTSPEKIREYVKTLKKMVDCKTVFMADSTNQGEYDAFYTVLEQEFPGLHAKAKRLVFGSGCFVYIIEGKNAKKNVMIMSHHDVVDGDDAWQTNPFEAVEKDGALWGRGTIDTKTPLFAELQACEELLQEGYDFDGINLYIGSSNNEEIGGDGMVLATEYFREKGIRFDVVLDEGGAITTGMIPGVKNKSAVVAVHEKSRHLYKCTAKQVTKGHGGLNPTMDNALVRMSSFINEVSNKKIYKGRFYPEVKATFTRHAPYMSIPMKLLFGNFTLFGSLIKKIMLNIPQTNAMLSTGITFTTMFAGAKDAPQSKSKIVEANMLLRCVREDDLLVGLEKIKKIGGKYGVEIEEILRDYCEPTDFENRPYKVLEEVLNENFPDVIVSPFLLTAGTDARHFTGIADSILRFAPIDLDKAQFASIHGSNEHIKIKNIGECVCFYKDFVKRI
jgi:carboxypeptidase PM20D1